MGGPPSGRTVQLSKLRSGEQGCRARNVTGYTGVITPLETPLDPSTSRALAGRNRADHVGPSAAVAAWHPGHCGRWRPAGASCRADAAGRIHLQLCVHAHDCSSSRLVHLQLYVRMCAPTTALSLRGHVMRFRCCWICGSTGWLHGLVRQQQSTVRARGAAAERWSLLALCWARWQVLRHARPGHMIPAPCAGGFARTPAHVSSILTGGMKGTPWNCQGRESAAHVPRAHCWLAAASRSLASMKYVVLFKRDVRPEPCPPRLGQWDYRV